VPAGERPIDAVLAEDHAELEVMFRRVIAGAHAGDWQELRALWETFERQLASHLAAEECYVLPSFAREHPAEAGALLAEHATIKAALIDLGVDLDLHCLRAERVEDFIAALRAHARREDRLVYPWAARRLPASRREALEAVLGHLPWR
jgi:hypothetical protein